MTPQGMISDRYGRAADGFTRRATEMPSAAWEATAPCEGWVARDVVRHLVEWVPAFFADAGGPSLVPGPSVDDDPLGSWTSLDVQIRQLLDDPEASAMPIEHPHAGAHRFDDAIATFVL